VCVWQRKTTSTEAAAARITFMSHLGKVDGLLRLGISVEEEGDGITKRE